MKKILKFSYIIIIIILANMLSGVSLAAPVTVVAFEPNGLTGSEVTFNATTNEANLNIAILSRGPGITPASLANAFSSDTFSSGGTKATAISNGDYLQLAIGAKANHRVSLSSIDFNVRRSSTGPNAYQWQYSLDGFATAGIDVGAQGSYSGTENNGLAMPKIDLSGVANLQNVIAGTTITFRLYAWGATTGVGTFAIGRLAGDDLVFEGNVNLYHTLTYTAGVHGSIVGVTPQIVDDGSDGTAVNADPEAHYHFVNWSDTLTANPRTDINVTNNISVIANFAIDTFTLTYTAGVHGSIVGVTPQTVNYGADGTTVTATPDPGYHFVSWDDGILTAARTETNVTTDHSPTANFAIDTSGGGGGGYIPTPPQIDSSFAITIKEGEIVSNRNIIIVFSGITNARQVAISESSFFTGSSWVNYGSEVGHTLSEQAGEKILYIKFRSSTGGETGYYTKKLFLLSSQIQSPIDEGISETEGIDTEIPSGAQIKLFVFTRDLSIGMVGPDVKELQKFLNTNGFIVAETGAGSPGEETSKFGAATRAALIKFQKANKISPAVGYFGSLTRNVVNIKNGIPTTDVKTVVPMSLSWRSGLSDIQKTGVVDLLNRAQNGYTLNSFDKVNLNYALGTSWYQNDSQALDNTIPESTYSGGSVVDYLIFIGQDSSFTNRAKLAAFYGIIDYAGTVEQNLQLLDFLK